MVGIKKKPFQGKGKRVFVTIDNFCLGEEKGAGALRAIESVNCDCSDGSIRTGVGLTRLEMGGKEVMVNLSGDNYTLYLVEDGGTLDCAERTESLFCMPADEKLYRYNVEAGAGFDLLFHFSRGSRCCMVASPRNEWVALFPIKDGFYMLQGGAWTFMEVPNATTAMCYCKGRVFLGKKQRGLLYSEVDSPWIFSSKLDESGEIFLPYDFGEIVALINFRDCVYAFYDYGVVQVDAAGSPLEFSVKSLDYSGGKIYGSTVGICNNYIMFLTDNGVVRFNGTKFEKVAKNLDIRPKRDTQVCNYAACENNYLVRYSDSRGGMRTALVAPDGGGYYVTDRLGLSQSGGRAFCIKSGVVYEIVSSGNLVGSERYSFESRKTNFGIAKKKIVKSIRLEGEGTYTFALYCDGTWRSNTVPFDGGVAVIPIDRRGTEFAFEFQLDKNAVIRRATVEMIVTD